MALALLLVSGGFGWLADDGGVFFRLARQRRRESGGFGWLADECGFFFPDAPTTVGGGFHPTALPSRGEGLVVLHAWLIHPSLSLILL